MRRIFHHSSAWIAKHKRHHHLALATLALIIAGAGAYTFRHEFAQAATFNFTQTSWAGGASETMAMHLRGDNGSDQTGWTYSSSTAGTNISAGATVTLSAPTSYSFTDDSATSSTSGITSGGGFGNGATSGTVVSAGSVGLDLGFSATGGTITYVDSSGLNPRSSPPYANGYTIHTFTSGSTLAVIGSGNINYAVIGGGGAGGATNGGNGGGGGAGGYIETTGYPYTATTGAYGVTVGSGGTGVANLSGNNGGSSIFNTGGTNGGATVTAYGGGGGTYASSLIAGKDGASGGGAGGGTASRSGGVATPSGQGYAGGNNGGTSAYAGGGGGGAGGLGGNANNTGPVVGNGGAGTSSSITGTSVCRAGGGGAGIYIATGGGTATCGGGAGASANVNGNPGTANTGGGGGGIGKNLANGNLGGAGGSGVVIVRYLPVAAQTTGTFTSASINLGGKASPAASPTLSWTTGGTGTITMEYATSTDNSAWSAYSSITNGGNINGASAGIQYVKYRATFTGDGTTTPTLNDVTIVYSQYAGSGNLTSSIYDSGDTANTISKITWVASGTDSAGDEAVRFQVRSAPESSPGSGVPGTWTNWCGPSTACAGTDYFHDPTDADPTNNNGVLFASGHPLSTGSGGVGTPHDNDRYLQYKAFLTSGGDVTPVLSSVTTQYVVNAAPIVTSVTASQNSDGTVTVAYSASDDDNGYNASTASSLCPINSKCADVTLQYCTTGSCTVGNPVGWADASSVSGTGVGTAVELSTNKSITWTPATEPAYLNQYTASQKIRIKANDRDAANNLGYDISGTFTLDTKAPTITAFTLDSSGDVSDIVNLNISDNTTSGIQYQLCDDVALTQCGTGWASISSGVATPVSKALIGTGGNDRVTLQAKDAYGNSTTTTAVGPANPSSFDFKDISNVATGDYREFISWSVFTATTSSQFASYKVYHKIDTDPGFTLLSTITDPAINYYTHTITTATSSTHYYKVVTTDTDADISDRTTILSDVPNGQGGSDTTAPQIVGAITVPGATLKNNSAVVAFTTDEISKGTVQYSENGLNTWTTVPSLSYVIDHSIYLPNLLANQIYNVRVKAEDPNGNGASDPYTNGPNFTTVGGPVISEITEKDKTDNSVTIEWKTSTSSDSYVYYATSVGGLSGATPDFNATQASCVSVGVCQHQIHLTNLAPGITYYYSVKSTDSDNNISTADKYTEGSLAGTQLSFTTTHDVTAPVISTSTTPVLSSTAAVIVWATDEPANSQVIWGATDANLNFTSTLDSTMTLIHVKTLSTDVNDLDGSPIILTPDTPYYYRVKSSDPAGNPTTFPALLDAPATFRTTTTGETTITYVTVASTAGDSNKDTTPPSISNVTVSDITPFGATVKFGTSEDANAGVEYGKDTSYGDIAGEKLFNTTHTIKLRGLTLGTDYHIKVSAIDKAGLTGTSADQTFKTTFLSENLKDMANVENIEQFQKEIESAIESILPSLVPPFVTKPIISDITESGATISFKTNIKAFPVVVYAEDGAYDETKDNPYTGEVSDTVTKDVSHTLALTGLKGNTKYHVQARGFSLPKVIGKSADVTFITKASKIAGSIVERKKDSFTVVWTTEEPTSSIVEFKDLKRGITERKVDEAKKTSHSMKIENLPSGTAYEVNLSGMTEQGNIAEAGSPLSVTTSTDTTPPGISGFKVDNALVPGRTDRIQTIVSWMTDEPSNSTVYYEEGAGTAGDTTELANKNEVLDSFVTGHSIILPSLKPGTIYRLKVTSADDSGNLGSFGPRTVITPQQTASITDIIFKNFEDSFKFLRKI